MAYPAPLDPSIAEWQRQFAEFLAKYGYDVTITVKRGEDRHTYEILAYSKRGKGE